MNAAERKDSEKKKSYTTEQAVIEVYGAGGDELFRHQQRHVSMTHDKTLVLVSVNIGAPPMWISAYRNNSGTLVVRKVSHLPKNELKKNARNLRRARADIAKHLKETL